MKKEARLKKTVIYNRMYCGRAQDKVNMCVIGSLAADFITHTPVNHTGKLCEGFFQSLMGQALLRWVVNGQLPFTRLRQGKRPLICFLLSTILQKPGKGNTPLSRPMHPRHRLRVRTGRAGGGRERNRKHQGRKRQDQHFTPQSRHGKGVSRCDNPGMVSEFYGGESHDIAAGAKVNLVLPFLSPFLTCHGWTPF